MIIFQIIAGIAGILYLLIGILMAIGPSSGKKKSSFMGVLFFIATIFVWPFICWASSKAVEASEQHDL